MVNFDNLSVWFLSYILGLYQIGKNYCLAELFVVNLFLRILQNTLFGLLFCRNKI